MSWNTPYGFGANTTIVMKANNGKYIRATPGNEGQADANGGTGPHGQWNIELHNGQVKLKHPKTGKYLRIKNDHGIDIGGGGGPWTLFKVHGNGNDRKLESVKVPGIYIAVNRQGKLTTGKGGPFCLIHFFRNAPQWNQAYIFKVSNRTVVFKANNGKYIRATPGNESQADANGGTGPHGQWTIELHNNGIKLKHPKTGKYLRIKQDHGIDIQGTGGPWTVFTAHGNGNERKLESNKVKGIYIAVNKQGKLTTGSGGPFCKLHFFRQ